MDHNAFILPALPQIEFSVTKTKIDALSPTNHHEAHIHKTCEVYINLSGNVSFAVEDRLYPISRGSVIITRPYEYHHCVYHSNAMHEHYWITFSTEQGLDFLRIFFDREKGVDNHITLDESALTEVCDVLNGLTCDQTDVLERRIMLLRFFQILSKSSRHSTPSGYEHLPDDVAVTLEYIENHLCEDIDVETLAKIGLVSVNTLERHFKESVGLSPMTAFRRKRMLTSLMYLRNGFSVTEAAQKSGFSDYSNYIQLFRKQFGMTPGEYKRIMKEKI